VPCIQETAHDEKLGVGGSKTTAICEGFSRRRISSRVKVKPKGADVFNPLELIRGFFMKA